MVDDLKVFVKPRSTITVRASTSHIKKYYKSNLTNDEKTIYRLNKTNQYNLLFKLNFRQCVIGEVYQNTSNM